MTNEEMERAISFLIENHAKHDAEIAEMRGMIAETNRAVQMMATSQAEVNGMLTRAIVDLASAQQQMQAQLGELQAGLRATNEQLRDTDARLRDTDARLRDTDARLRDTDARLNILINVVERLAGGE